MNVPRAIRTFSGACVLAAAGAACSGSPATNPNPAPLRPAAFARAASALVRVHGPLLPPARTIYLGAFVAPNPNPQPAQQIVDTANFESQIGRKLAVNLHYHLWSDTLAGLGEQDDVNNGRIPMISWSCVDSNKTGVKDADVAAGLYDSAIAKRAAALANLKSRVFLRYKWEMNLVYNPQCADPAHDIHDPYGNCLLYTSPSPRDGLLSRMPSSA